MKGLIKLFGKDKFDRSADFNKPFRSKFKDTIHCCNLHEIYNGKADHEERTQGGPTLPLSVRKLINRIKSNFTQNRDKHIRKFLCNFEENQTYSFGVKIFERFYFGEEELMLRVEIYLKLDPSLNTKYSVVSTWRSFQVIVIHVKDISSGHFCTRRLRILCMLREEKAFRILFEVWDIQTFWKPHRA